MISHLDRWFPPAGPCAFCGHADKRHRLWDALLGNFRAGESVADIASCYGLSYEAVQAVIYERPYQRSRWRRSAVPVNMAIEAGYSGA